MKPIRKIVATVGQYVDSTGKQKNRYVRVGTLFKREDDSVCMKLDSLPMGNEWNGWLNCYALDDEQNDKPAAPASNAYADAKGRAPAPAQQGALDPVDEDIPF